MRFWGIRTKFLTVFIISVAITLLVAISVSYASIDSVYMRINERNTNAEFSQMAGEIDMLLTETENLLLSRIINNEAAGQVVRYRKLSVSDLSYAIQDLAEEVASITAFFDYIDSVYVYVADDWFLAMSNANTRRFHDADLDWPSERILELLSEADATMSIAGYVSDEDFPLVMSEPAYLMLYKKAYHMNGKNYYCVNIKESALYDKYAGYVEDGVRFIRILDREGMIVSSADKSEIGTQFAPLEGKVITESGMIDAEGVVINYRPLEKYGLVIVSSIPTSVYTKDLTVIRNQLVLVFVVGMVISLGFFYYWIEQKLKPIRDLCQGMKIAGQGDYSKHLIVKGTDELAELTENYNTMLTDLQQLTDSRRQAEIELRERELAVLRNEINPHFLYNTLNTVKCMAELEGNGDIARCIVALGGIIAPLYKNRGATWTLKEELRLAEKYLEIMNIRYGNVIRFTENVPQELLDRQIMRFILQPMIENSITHGFAKRAYAGNIILTVEEKEENLWITIDDDGSGMTDEELKRFNTSLQSGIETGGVGMMNVSRRIALRYGTQYGTLLLRSDYGGLCARMVLPGGKFL